MKRNKTEEKTKKEKQDQDAGVAKKASITILCCTSLPSIKLMSRSTWSSGLNLSDEEKEYTTGVSRLSQGLSKDAVSKQNSAAMVEQLATLSMQILNIFAINLANQFVRPLF